MYVIRGYIRSIGVILFRIKIILLICEINMFLGSVFPIDMRKIETEWHEIFFRSKESLERYMIPFRGKNIIVYVYGLNHLIFT
jgi:hypothetical protein